MCEKARKPVSSFRFQVSALELNGFRFSIKKLIYPSSSFIVFLRFVVSAEAETPTKQENHWCSSFGDRRTIWIPASAGMTKQGQFVGLLTKG